MKLHTTPDAERLCVSVGTFSGRNGKLVEHAALTREEALRAAAVLLSTALLLPCGQPEADQARSGRQERPG